jgi:hypothetical protein
MSHTLKTDLALFAVAFIASVFLLAQALQADTGLADILGAVPGVH